SRAAREAYHARIAKEVAEKTIEAKPTIEKAIEEIIVEAKEEPKTKDADEEEALKAEAPVAVTDLNPEEQRKRRLIRWMKLKEINHRYAVIKLYGGKCVVVTAGRSPVNPNKKIFIFQSREAFEQWKANEFIPSLEKKNKNDAVGPWWWRHPKRRQYDGAVFRPLAPSIVRTSDGQLLLNTYLGWGVEPKQGDWSLIRQHIKAVLANGDPKTDDYIIRWTAWGFQYPDILPLVALVLIGLKGRGKGTFARVLEIIYGDHSLQISSQRHIVGNFNAHLENLILMISDEAYWAGHKADAGTLQRMITEPTLAIEAKGYDVRNVRNYIHLLMLAEPGWSVPAGQDERRYAVYEVSKEARDEAYFKTLYREIAGGGPAAMLYDLQRMDLGDWHPRQVYKTNAFRRQQDMSLGHLEEWLLTLLEDGCLPSSPTGKPWASTPTNLLYDAKHKVPRLRDLSFNQLADFLKEWGCDKSGGDDRLWRFRPLTEIRAAWDQRYAPREWSPIGDWGYQPKPPLRDLLNEKL
ncbi:MAG: primase-helicase family protein, partial [Xanthobacteraceae bacterium]